MSAPYVGQCLCGAIRYEVLEEPSTVYACHRSDCQRRTGSALASSMIVSRQAIQIAQGMKAIGAPPLLLEPQLATHAREMFVLLSDPAIYEFENHPPSSEEWLRARYEGLESRQSPDGTQSWLNWVIRVPSGVLAGYVQATVLPSGVAYVAYELASRYWRQGVASSSVTAVLAALRESYAVNLYVAVLKAANYRSLGLLRKLGFEPASTEQFAEFGGEADELVMVKPARAAEKAP